MNLALPSGQFLLITLLFGFIVLLVLGIIAITIIFLFFPFVLMGIGLYLLILKERKMLGLFLFLVGGILFLL